MIQSLLRWMAMLDEIRKRIEGIQAAQPGPEQESD
jgi:hypothetical protein